MDQEMIERFRTLTSLPGAPGFEHDVRKYMKEELAKYADEVIQDKLGSIFGVKYGKKGPKVMVAGHMDEVGFMVKYITKNGMLKFIPLGGWSPNVLQSQKVIVHSLNGPIYGVVSSTPPHLGGGDKPDINEMMIDIGADSRDHALGLGVRPGQPITPMNNDFLFTADGKKIMAKAWDNRYGCGMSIELLKAVKDVELPNTLYSGATVQEEVGLRGAQTAASLIQPDIFFALDCSPANDMTGDEMEFGQIGKGVLLRVYDRSYVTHRGMKEFLLDTLETHHIPYQYFMSQGGTDAGRVHLHGEGVPSILVGVCARYIHSHVAMVHIDDLHAAREALVQLVKALDQSTLEIIVQNV